MAGFTQMVRRVATECTGMRVRQVSRLLTRIYDDCLRPLGIQETQYSVLVAVAMFGEDGVTMGALAGTLVMDRTTLTRNIVPLEKAGYLRVARSAADARARVILLTRSGERLIESAYPLWEEAQSKIRRTLGEDRFDALRSQLSEVLTFTDELEVNAAE
ncbi:MarR family winged helix-turn-helix transcriptional regulator [Pendulispora brunnea]|uniref:MarR family winged helix-turn-helix transcriptional regulator n=1 Tax=Pendulispora brunnea TaxID=2905690 RepID=A0ABZ2KAY9_9BACT